MRLRESTLDDINELVDISKAAFDTDITVGGRENDGPPDYDSTSWHTQMFGEGHLFTYTDENDVIVGGAVLFSEESSLYVGRIFISPKNFGCGLGMSLMEEIENKFMNAKVIKLDTPIWNIRTNKFYKKCGYIETARDQETVYFEKK